MKLASSIFCIIHIHRAVADERLKLAQKYGYELPEEDQVTLGCQPDTVNKKKSCQGCIMVVLSQEEAYMLERKDVRQIFYGLQPGWIVSLADKVRTIIVDVLLLTRACNDFHFALPSGDLQAQGSRIEQDVSRGATMTQS